MTMEIVLEKACAAHMIYLKKSSAPFFITMICLLLVIVLVLVLLIIKARLSNKTRTVLLKTEDPSPKAQIDTEEINTTNRALA